MGRAPCCDKNGLKKGPWTTEEDQKLIDYIQRHGHGSWRTLPKNAGLARCGKSCRLRWTNYLRPDIKRGRFSFEEEETIIQLHSVMGNKWSAIAGRLPGRTDNEIKNYWNTHIRKRLLRMGIDPVTHSPRLDLLDLSSLFNPAFLNPAQVDVSRFLGIEPLLNSEFLRFATNLLQSHCQQNQLQDPQANATISPSFLQNPVQQTTSDAELVHSGQFHSGELSSLCQENESFTLCNFSENFDPAINNILGYHENVEQSMPNFINDASNYQITSNQNYSCMTSVLSTPASSPINNSCSTYLNSSTEDPDDKDSYCSNLFKFQIPELLDVSDFM